ncbi:hypothetical protein RC52_04440 [Herbaspirillum rubrisubalbicans]|nr:hypothetical protein [Herbaspirillum rubrisubalbicans]
MHSPRQPSLSQFRRTLLDALTSSLRRHGQARLYLLYAPELCDPLSLAEDEVRLPLLIQPAFTSAQRWALNKLPRLILLGGLHEAQGAGETHSALDDPLLEASITQSYAETVLGQRVNVLHTNDDPGQAERAVCGWIISPEVPATLCWRINTVSVGVRKDGHRRWIAWYNPACIETLWPILTPGQRLALAGPATWMFHDDLGQFKSIAGVEAGEGALIRPGSQGFHLDDAQWQRLDHVPIVQRLLAQWHVLCLDAAMPYGEQPLQRLHTQVSRARRYGLDGENLSLCVLIAMQMPPEFTESPEFGALLSDAARHGDTLRQRLEDLPLSCWSRPSPKRSLQ